MQEQRQKETTIDRFGFLGYTVVGLVKVFQRLGGNTYFCRQRQGGATNDSCDDERGRTAGVVCAPADTGLWDEHQTTRPWKIFYGLHFVDWQFGFSSCKFASNTVDDLMNPTCALGQDLPMRASVGR